MLNKRNNQAKAIKELLKKKFNSREELAGFKRKLSKKYGIKILLNSEILKEYKRRVAAGAVHESLLQEKILRKRSIRTLSGIASVAVLVKPFKCPGKCVYCPSEKDVPKSYLSNEPAVMRAIRCHYDPYKQVQLRLRALEANGHQPNKIELIVIGGTWSTLPRDYKYWFIKECFRAANQYGARDVILEGAKRLIESRRDPIAPFSHSRMTIIKDNLNKEQKKNEKAKYRIIGITIETRPDYINIEELLEMRELGCTRVELGVQAIDDEILKLNKRGHGITEIVRATKLLKDFGFKVTYHIMPGLPGSTARKDLRMFSRLFTDQRFQPDQIKFYPTVVTRGSLLYSWWRSGKYKPYTDKVLRNLIIECKKAVPPYVRIIRLIRDIPGESIIAGNTITNLRQVLQAGGVSCRCIRCREARDKKFSIFNFQFSIIEYEASAGKEYFIQATDKKDDTLYGFCRLRLTQDNKTQITDKEFIGAQNIVPLRNATLIRELHVYGELVPVGSKKIVQHAGLGRKLMARAERLAKQKGFNKMAVIAGVGVRDYYRKLGYKLNHSYMVKSLI